MTDRRLRIGLIVPGGVDRSGAYRVIPAVLWLLERLAARHEVHVVVPNQEPEPAHWRLRGAAVHNVVGRPWQPAAARALLRLHAEMSLDVIHALWARGPGEAALLGSVATGRPYLVHLAGGELVWDGDSHFGSRAWRRAVAGVVLRRASVVTAASAPMLRRAREAGVHAERVPLGVDLGTWSAAATTRRVAAGPLRLVTVGSLTPVKDHGTLLRAVATLRDEGIDVELDLVGEDTSGGAIPRLVERLGLSDRVRVHGFVPQPDIVPLVAAAHLYVVSSRHEAGPVAMLEAGAVGVPTVGTRVGQVPEWAAAGAAVAVPVGDARALADAIRSLVHDEERRLTLAVAARSRAQAEDADWTAERFESLYRTAVREGGLQRSARAPWGSGAVRGEPRPRAPERHPEGDDDGRDRERLRAWTRSGLTHDLWPDLGPAELAQAHHALLSVTRSIVRGAGRSAQGASAPDGTPELRADSVRALGVAAFLAGMGPLLGRWIEDGRLRAAPNVAELLARHLDHGRRRADLLDRRAADAVAGLGRSGIAPILLKGIHTGHVYFPEPGTRPAADIDLLVRPDDRPSTESVLQTLGYHEIRRTRWADRSEWRHRDAPRDVHAIEMDHERNPWTLDLHTSVGRWYFRGVRRELGQGVFESTERIDLRGDDVRVLEWPALVAFLALHASHDLVKTRVVRLIELVQISRSAPGTEAWTRLRSLLDHTDTVRFTWPALELAERFAPGTIDPDLLAAGRASATARTRRMVAAVEAASMAPLPAKSLDAMLMWCQGVRETVLNVSEVVVPSDDGLPGGRASALLRRAGSVLRGRARWRAGPTRGRMGSP